MTSTMQRENWIAKILRRAASSALGVAVFLAPAVVATRAANAQTISVLHRFSNGLDGSGPYGGLVRDEAGNLYGATTYGGGHRRGMVFKLDVAGNMAVLHGFNGADGEWPVGSLVRDTAGNLYGTTYLGGDLTCNPPHGCGTVFKLDTTGTETVLHTFTGGTDGRFPLASLVRDSAGNLYGTTREGGSDLTCGSGTTGCGAVFKLDTTGTETVLYRFAGGVDGRFPVANLVRDAAGNLYGTTEFGGNLGCRNGLGCGTVFKINP